MLRGEDRPPRDLLQRDPPADRDVALLAELIARVAAGRQDALRALYDRTAPKLFGLILRIVRDRAAAEDVLQDSYCGSGSMPEATPGGGAADGLARRDRAPPRHRLGAAKGRGADAGKRDDEEDWLQRIADPRDREASS